jgi:mono/diheme cytochrome c family protein
MKTILAVLALSLFLTAPAVAQDRDQIQHAGHGGGDAVAGTGVVNAVDAAARKVNLGEEPATPILLASSDPPDHEIRHGDGSGHDDGNGQGDHGEHWTAPEAERSRVNPVAVTDAGLARAAETFAENCAMCHGETGAGDGPAAADLDPRPSDLKMMAATHPDGDLAWKISNGRNFMPPWGEVLDEETIWQLVNYLRNVIGARTSEPAPQAHGPEQEDHAH